MLKIINDPLDYFLNLTKDDNPYDWFKIMGIKCLIVNDAVAMKHVFQDNYENYRKSHFHKGLKPLLGNGIFLSEGELWKGQRRETAPFFSGKHFPRYIEDMTISAAEMVNRIKHKAGKHPDSIVDINAETMWFTLDVVLRALFHDPRTQIAEQIKDSLGLLLKDAEDRIWDLVSVPQSIKMNFFPEYKNALSFLNETVQDMISASQSKADNHDDFIAVISERYDTSNKIEKDILRDQIMSFLLAGHETSANALTWSIFEIAKSESLKKQAYQSIEGLDGDFTADAFDKLTYIQGIFEESLRLYPPVWTMSRQANAADTIPFENGEQIAVAKNQIVMLSPYTMHRSPRYWNDPLVFDPCRFDVSNRSRITKFSYIPYGGGPRLCMGHKFANLEGTIGLVEVLKNFEFNCINEHEIKPEPLITLRPNTHVLMQFKDRTQSHVISQEHAYAN